jgi:hypothetical protein
MTTGVAATAAPAVAATTTDERGSPALLPFTPGMAGRRTILMVEDETSITEPLAEALDREGFATRVDGTVADAISAEENEVRTL